MGLKSKLILLTSALIFVGAVGAQPAKQQLRVLVYNIRWGERADIETLARVIMDADPDFVALQEVSVGVKYWNKCAANNVQAISEFSKHTGLYAIFGGAMPIKRYAFGFGGGEFGNVVLSKYPFESTRKHTYAARGTEPRVGLESIVLFPGGERLRFVSTHLDHNRDSVRRLQVEELNRVFGQDDVPTIMCGDFNEKPEASNGCIDYLLRSWMQCCRNDEKTFIAWNPTVKLDYVFARPATNWRVVESRVVDEPQASDHRPLLVVLEMN